MENLEEIRREIDAIDEQMAGLFERRMEQSRKVAEYKMARGLAVTDSGREAEVIKRNASLVSDRQIRDHYINFEKDVIEISKQYQRALMDGMKVAYSGKPGAFAYIAATRLFPNALPVPYPDFTKAYKACADGECDAVVLPFENSFAGDVSTVTDLMFSGDLYVNQVIEVEVEHCLAALPDADPAGIQLVVSHPQALSQCEEYIKAKGLREEEFSNTADAAKAVAAKGDPTVAAICSREAAEIYGLKVVEARINTSRSNTTRFAAFNRTLNLVRDNRKMGKHFILMFTVKNEAGALAKTLNIIGTHNYNMCNLHSRPMKTLMWSYSFFIELDGDIATAEGDMMLRELGSVCDRLKLVGSFFKR